MGQILARTDEERIHDIGLEVTAWKRRDSSRLCASSPDLTPETISEVLDLLEEEALAAPAFLSQDDVGRSKWWSSRVKWRVCDRLRKVQHPAPESLDLLAETGRELAADPGQAFAALDDGDEVRDEEREIAARVVTKMASKFAPDELEAIFLYYRYSDDDDDAVVTGTKKWRQEDIARKYGWSPSTAFRVLQRSRNVVEHFMSAETPTDECVQIRNLHLQEQTLASSTQRALNQHMANCRCCRSWRNLHVLAGLLVFAPTAPWWKVKLAALAQALHIGARKSAGASGAGASGGSAAAVGGKGAISAGLLAKAAGAVAVGAIAITGAAHLSSADASKQHHDSVLAAAAAIPITTPPASAQTQMASWAHANRQAAAQTRRHKKKHHNKRRHHNKHHAPASAAPAAPPAQTYTQPAPAPYTPPATSSGGSGGGGSSSSGGGSPSDSTLEHGFGVAGG